MQANSHEVAVQEAESEENRENQEEEDPPDELYVYFANNKSALKSANTAPKSPKPVSMPQAGSVNRLMSKTYAKKK